MYFKTFFTFQEIDLQEYNSLLAYVYESIRLKYCMELSLWLFIMASHKIDCALTFGSEIS